MLKTLKRFLFTTGVATLALFVLTATSAKAGQSCDNSTQQPVCATFQESYFIDVVTKQPDGSWQHNVKVRGNHEVQCEKLVHNIEIIGQLWKLQPPTPSTTPEIVDSNFNDCPIASYCQVFTTFDLAENGNVPKVFQAWTHAEWDQTWLKPDGSWGSTKCRSTTKDSFSESAGFLICTGVPKGGSGYDDNFTKRLGNCYPPA